MLPGGLNTARSGATSPITGVLPKAKDERKGRSSTRRLCRNSRETACSNIAAAEDGRAPVFGQHALTEPPIVNKSLSDFEL